MRQVTVAGIGHFMFLNAFILRWWPHAQLYSCRRLAVVQGSSSSPLLGTVCMQDCSAGDSAAYQRRNSTLDDVVIVAALRTPLTKVRAWCLACTRSFGWLTAIAATAACQTSVMAEHTAWPAESDPSIMYLSARAMQNIHVFRVLAGSHMQLSLALVVKHTASIAEETASLCAQLSGWCCVSQPPRRTPT
jgi:hypothetical protein